MTLAVSRWSGFSENRWSLLCQFPKRRYLILILALLTFIRHRDTCAVFGKLANLEAFASAG